jgi:hypothetical protein
MTALEQIHHEQQPAPLHYWEVVAESPGVQQHRCVYCRASRRTVRSEGVMVVTYLKLGRASDNAPPCFGRR